MGFFGLLSLAFGLSADAFAAALCKGIGLHSGKMRAALTVGAFFGTAQALMTAAGSLLGELMYLGTKTIGPLISLILLSAVGAKMIYDGIHAEHEIKISSKLNLTELLFLAWATAIDAFSIGISLAFLDVNIITAAALIGTVTFALSFAGVFLGAKLNSVITFPPEIVGGILLILLGVKIFLS